MIKRTIKQISELVSGKLILNSQTEDTLVEGFSLDSRLIEKGNLYIPIVGARFDGHTFISNVEEKGAVLTLCSNESFIPSNMACIVVEDTVAAFQELATNYRLSLHAHVIGITGSNGKTSTKDILAGILSSKYKTQKTLGNHNNELGVPITLLELDEDCEMAIIEMGMENAEEIHFLNNIVHQDDAIITKIGSSHLMNFDSIDGIGFAKLEIVDALKENGVFVYPHDDEVLHRIIDQKEIPSGVKVKTFGESDECDMVLKTFRSTDKGIYITTNKSDFEFFVPILGRHQARNTMAALQIAYSLGMKDEEIQKGLDNIQNTSMRNELLSVGKCRILNDCYNANPQSTIAALDTFETFDSKYKVVVLADMLELGKDEKQLHYDVGAALKNYKYNELLCFGDLATNILDGAKATCEGKIFKHFTNHEDMITYLKEYINKECMILFKGSRGNKLDIIVNKLKELGM